MAKKRWTEFMGSKIAFTNFNGFGDPNNLRANFITGENMDKEFPKFDKPRLCGGYVLPIGIGFGRIEGNTVVIPTVNATRPLPSLTDVLERKLYFTAVSVGRNFAVEFPYGYAEPSLMLLISSQNEMYYPLEKFISVRGALPNPYQYQ